MARNFSCLTLLAVGIMGCQPFEVLTDSTVRIPHLPPVHLTLDSPPTRIRSPVAQVPLPGGPSHCSSKVAVIDIDGLLLNTNMIGLYSSGENPAALFSEKLAAVEACPDVCAVVLRINSPGGSVAATDLMWRELVLFRRRTKLPMVACLLDVAAGGAYYLATAADRIVAQPTTVTGGIGVIWNTYNLRDLMAQFNVTAQFIKAGTNIDLGTTTAALSVEARRLLQEIADEFHEQFIHVVKETRPKTAGTKELFDGRVFTASKARTYGLIDEIGYLPDAIRLAGERAGHEAVQAVLFRRPNDPAFSPLAITPNTPLQSTLLPLSLPGIERSRLPTFLYLWEPEPTLQRLSGP